MLEWYTPYRASATARISLVIDFLTIPRVLGGSEKLSNGRLAELLAPCGLLWHYDRRLIGVQLALEELECSLGHPGNDHKLD